MLLCKREEVHLGNMSASICGFPTVPHWNSTAESDTDHYIPHLPNHSDFRLKKLAYASNAYATSCSQSLMKIIVSQLLNYSLFCSGNIIHGLQAHRPQYQGTQRGTALPSPLGRPFLIHRPPRQDIELGRAPRVSPSQRCLRHQGTGLGRAPRVSLFRRCLRHQDIELDRALLALSENRL